MHIRTCLDTSVLYCCLSRVCHIFYHKYITVQGISGIESPRALLEIQSPLARAFVAFYSMIISLFFLCVTMVICFNVRYISMHYTPQHVNIPTYNSIYLEIKLITQFCYKARLKS